MGNASYHSTVKHKVPNTGSLKKDTEEWLRNNCNEYGLRKPYHWQICNQIASFRCQYMPLELI
jgi:hypothetical protein